MTALRIALFLTVSPLLLFAGSGPSTLPPAVRFLLAAFNFGLLIVLVVKFAGPAIADFFGQRAAALRAALEGSRTDHEQTLRTIEDLRRAITDLPAEEKRIDASYRDRAAMRYEDIMNTARLQGEFIRREAERSLHEELMRCRTDILSSVSRRIVAALTAKARELGPDQHGILIRSFADLSRGKEYVR